MIARDNGGLELWGGVECTVNRVGDRYFDQLESTGHADRLGDLDRIAALGIRTLRYPIVWERTAPRGLDDANFSWTDERIGRLRELGIRVIAGLVHHGSGPRHTSLHDREFPSGLAEFAQAVAQRYPFIEDFTPINEPLTTARFSGLYGHWFPHLRSAADCNRALLIETQATIAAMSAIRKVTPHARLVQTEDIGTVYATPRLRYQAAFENQRRWLSLDLLFGRVNPDHSLFRFLLAEGSNEQDLRDIAARACPPDVIGVNYYVTSDRFLDDRLKYYPEALRGTNGRHIYADVEAVRVRPGGIVGHCSLLEEVWNRYRVPLAITEAHLGCAPEEQIRWLKEAWDGALAARERGADVRAVTVWSLFGSFDWDSLVTQSQGHYEPGAFDVRASDPHPTALANVARALATRSDAKHPLLNSPGWWRRADRFQFAASHLRANPGPSATARPVLVTGAGGLLGSAFVRACQDRGLLVHACSREDLDIGDDQTVDAALQSLRPWLLINAANTSHVSALAKACKAHDIRFVTFSSVHVFDGEKASAYVEADAKAPRCDLGFAHADREERVAALYPEALIVRIGHLFGHGDRTGIVARSLRSLRRGENVVAPANGSVSPSYATDVAHACLDLAVAETEGIVHVANKGAIAVHRWLELMCEAMGIAPGGLLQPSNEATLFDAPFPVQASMRSVRVPGAAPFEHALERYAREFALLHRRVRAA